MDKYCDGCFYACSLQDKGWKFCTVQYLPKILDNELGYKYKVKDGFAPACMVVQSHYKGKCPYYVTKKAEEKNNNDT